MKLPLYLPCIFLLLVISACSQKASQTTLKVKSAFAVSNTTLTGGTLIYGENLTTGRKFSIPLNLSTEKTLALENGKWLFAAVGWDGASMFQGQSFCAYTEVLVEQSMVVDLSMTALKCQEAGFQNLFNLKDLITISCDAFYSYNPVSDEFGIITADNFCETLPDNLTSDFKAHRLVALDTLNPAIQDFKSQCIAHSTFSRLKIPTKKFPFIVKLYRTIDECNNQTLTNKTFHFPNGISIGNKSVFDHDYSEVSSLARLVLPSSITNRGRSPFMNLVPSFLCNANKQDCIKEPTLSTDIRVDWLNTHDHQLILKNVNDNACTTFTYPNSKYFAFSECMVDDGNLKAKIHRNNLTCRPSPTGSYKDIYYKNDLFYLLKNNGVEDYVEIINQAGIKQNAVFLGNATNNSIAVTTNGEIYVGSQTEIKKIIYDSIMEYYTEVSVLNIENDHIDISPDGLNIYASLGTVLYSYHFDGTSISTYDLSENIVQLQVQGSYLYTGGTTGIYKFSPNAGILGSPAKVINSSSMTSFYYDGINFSTISNSGQVDIFSSSYTNILLARPTYSSPNTGLVALGKKIYFTDGITLQVHELNNTNNFIAIHAASGSCTENLTFISGFSSKTLSVESKNLDDTYNLFNDGFELLGRRKLANREKMSYYFQAYHHDREISTGGQLRRVQEMLSPDGIAGLLSEYPSCHALKLAAGNQPNREIIKKLQLFDPFESDTMNITLTVTAPLSSPVKDYICVDNNPYSTGCTENYDLEVLFVNHSTSESEKTRLRLSCDRRRGEMETLNNELSLMTTRKEQERFIWNTNDMTFARFEVYQYEEKGSQHRVKVVKAGRDNINKFWVKDLSYEIEQNVRGQVKELSSDGVNIMSSAYHLSADTEVEFGQGGELFPGVYQNQVRDEYLIWYYAPTANKCMVNTNTNVLATNNNSCTLLSSLDTVNSIGIVTNLASLMGINVPTHAIRQQFTLSDF